MTLEKPPAAREKSPNTTNLASELMPIFEQMPLEIQMIIGQMSCIPGLAKIFEIRRAQLQDEMLNIDAIDEKKLAVQYMLYRTEILFLQDIAQFFNSCADFYRTTQTGQP